MVRCYLDGEWVTGMDAIGQDGGIPGEADGGDAVTWARRGVAGELGELGVAGAQADGVAEEGGFCFTITGPYSDVCADGVP